MKVCLAALIPLLALLIVLPSDVGARRLEKNADGHLKKRSGDFMGSMSGKGFSDKLCLICHKYYEIDKDDCTNGRNHGLQNCLKKAEENQKFFGEKMNEPSEIDAANLLKKRSKEGMGGFSREAYDRKLCELCHQYYAINEDDCNHDKNEQKFKCLKEANENEKFIGDKMNAAFPV